MREMDFIRAISALSIIMIHVSGVYTAASRGAYTLNQLVRFAVPVFILISGLLLSSSGYEFSGVSGYLHFIGKRLRKIFIPYVLWSFIYILFKMRNDLSPVWTDPGTFLSDTGRKLLYGSAHVHLYFIIIILQLYLLFPILCSLIKSHKRLVLAISLLLTLAYLTGIYLQALKIFMLPAPILPNYMFFPTWIFYFVFGMVFSESLKAPGNVKTPVRKMAGNLGITGAVWAASFLILLSDSKLTGTFDLSIKPSVMLYSMAAFFFMYSAAVRLKGSSLKILKSLDWISGQSFTIYLGHLFIIKNILLFTGQPANTGMWSGLRGLLLLYAAGTICTCLFAYLVSITPFAAILGGVKAKRKKANQNNKVMLND